MVVASINQGRTFRMSQRYILIFMLLPIAFISCGCGEEEVTIQKICEKWGKCSTIFLPDLMECPYKSYDVLSKDCLEGLDRHICTEIDPEALEDLANTCWPECTPNGITCRGDYRVLCEGREHVVDCAKFCDEHGSSGTCGEETAGTYECICE